MNLSPDTFAAVFLVATVLFVFGLKGLASPKTALTGNRMAMLGMGIAVAVTLIHPDVVTYRWIWAGLLIGAVIGTVVALRIQMTAMPELVAVLHSFVGLSAVLVAIGTYMTKTAEKPFVLDALEAVTGTGGVDAVLAVELSLGSAIGAITFTGSVVAFGKLSGKWGSNPLVFPGQHILNAILGLAVVGLTVQFAMAPSWTPFLILTAISFALGVLLVVPIGGADMPVVVSMLNSYSGWAASATGFTLGNNLLIATGALVGSSGAILSYIMCKAMNRGFISVILGGFGGDAEVSTSSSTDGKQAKSAAAEDAAFFIENAEKVIIVPGYGMAVAQAQHTVKEFVEAVQSKGVEVAFAIHPVAGRMPGHMNVLLAEADIPYDIVFELESINSDFPTTDVVVVIGANDVVNPAAKTDKGSPLYGMPILDAYRSSMVYILKRSMKPGYSGVDNELFYYDNAQMIFGDAKETVEKMTSALTGAGH
jgi:NAD(P) transhydrogenase subunit beta